MFPLMPSKGGRHKGLILLGLQMASPVPGLWLWDVRSSALKSPAVSGLFPGLANRDSSKFLLLAGYASRSKKSENLRYLCSSS